ncbi:MAG TPA: hypothetical protein VH599_12175 [Ktedonobacterales bacterium]|jgi:hypothetical protein
MTLVGANLPLMQQLIHRLSQAEERLGPLLDDTYTAGSQFLETFTSPQKPQLEQEFNQLITDLRGARNYNYRLLTFLQILFRYLQEAEHVQQAADAAE